MTQSIDRSAAAAAAGETEVRIRSGAIALFASRGYAATGIRDIARAAGVTTASIYHYVKNKDELLVDIMRSGQTALNEAAERALEEVERPEDRLARLVSGLVGFQAVNQRTAHVADVEIRSLPHGSASRAEIVGLRDHYEELWRGVLDAGAEQGVFRLGDERVTRLALLAMCTGVTEWYRPAGDDNLVWLCQHFVGVALRAVDARRGRRALTPDDVVAVDLAGIRRMPWEPGELAGDLDGAA